MSPRIHLPAVVATALLLVAPLPASGDGITATPVKDPIVAKECRACHMLYPVGLLTAPSWRRMVAGLDNHFGENASVDPATSAHLVAYLTANAGSEMRRKGDKAPAPTSVEAPLRITELTWFIREHRGGRVSPATLQRKGVRSASDCVGCHKGAEAGEFDD